MWAPSPISVRGSTSEARQRRRPQDSLKTGDLRGLQSGSVHKRTELRRPRHSLRSDASSQTPCSPFISFSRFLRSHFDKNSCWIQWPLQHNCKNCTHHYSSYPDTLNYNQASTFYSLLHNYSVWRHNNMYFHWNTFLNSAVCYIFDSDCSQNVLNSNQTNTDFKR